MKFANLLKPERTEARLIDPALGILAGEASGQKVRNVRPLAEESLQAVFSGIPAPTVPPTYYRLPLLKEPTWIWSVPLYFYLGGIAGGAAILGGVVELGGAERHRRLVTWCHAASFTAVAAGSACLTYDLGRPLRFANMLRVVRPTSPMNLGSWVLVKAGAHFFVTLILDLTRKEMPLFRKLSAFAMIPYGIALSGYTGVLLANSTIPVWQANRRLLPVLFTASAAATTAALLKMVPLDEREAKMLKPFGLVAKGAELAAMIALEQGAESSGQLLKPLHEGKSGRLWQTGKILVAAGVAANVLPTKSKTVRRIGSVLSTLGALFLRFGLIEAGKESTLDPVATTLPQRRNIMIRDVGA